MNKFMWLSLALLAVASQARSDVVMGYQGAIQTGNADNAFYNSAGITFNVTGSSAGTGNWALQTVKFFVGGTNAFTLEGGRVSLWKDTGGSNYVFQGSQGLTGYNYSNGGGGATTEVTFGLAADNAFGTVGNLNSGLGVGTYLLGIDNLIITGGTTADGYFSASGTPSSGQWGPATSYWGTQDDLSGGLKFPNTGTITSLPNTFSDNFYVRLEAAAVPEPGTLILGGIAAVSGGAGAWWRRRKNRKAAAEQAV